jgi:pyroglutamyl-peptidase
VRSVPFVIAAFEPFAGRASNRALEAARLLDGTEIDGKRVEVATVPTVFAELPRVIEELRARAGEVLLLVGESKGARTLLVERMAINVIDARIADNAGARPRDVEVVPGGEAARRVRVDLRRVADAVRAAGVPCDISSHAGTFCCNAALYHALGQGVTPRVAFVHVPARWPWARDRRAARGLAAAARAISLTAGNEYSK